MHFFDVPALPFKSMGEQRMHERQKAEAG